MKISPLSYYKISNFKSNNYKNNAQSPVSKYTLPCDSFEYSEYETKNNSRVFAFNISDSESVKFEIPEKILKKHLSLDFQNPNEALVEYFLMHYRRTLIKELDINKRELAHYSNLYGRIEEKEKSSPYTEAYTAETFYQNEYRYNHGDMYQHLRNYVSKLSGTTKLAEIQDIMGIIRSKQKTLPEDTFYMTLRVMDMCRYQDKYDFRDMEEKNKIAKLIMHAQRELDLDDSDEFWDEIIGNSRDDKGRINFALIEQTLNIMMSEQMNDISPMFVMSNLKYFYDKTDPKDLRLVQDIMWDLSQGLFEISDENTYFRDLMGLCYDKNNRVDPIKAEAVVYLAKCSTDWITSLMHKFEQESENESVIGKKIKTALAISKDMIVEYFNLTSDSRGNFEPSFVNLSEYLKKFDSVDWI